MGQVASGLAGFAQGFTNSFVARKNREREIEIAAKDAKAKTILQQTATLMKLPKGQRAPFIKQMGDQLKVSDGFKGALLAMDDEYASRMSMIIGDMSRGERPALEDIMAVFQDPTKGLEFLNQANEQIANMDKGKVISNLPNEPTAKELRGASRKVLATGGTAEAKFLDAQAKHQELGKQNDLANSLGLTELTVDMKNFVGSVGGAKNFTAIGFAKFLARKFPKNPVKAKQAMATALHEAVKKDNPNFTIGEAWLTVVTGDPLVGKDAYKTEILSKLLASISFLPVEKQKAITKNAADMIDEIYPVITNQNGSIDDFFNDVGGFDFGEVQ